MSDYPQFTASQIARALGRARGAIYRELRDSEPTGVESINGKTVSAWRLDALPEKLRRDLWSAADQRGFKRPESLLQHGCEQWEPRIHLARIAPAHVDKARKLKQAYSEVLRYLDAKPWYDLRSIGLADYASVFGERVTARHWERTLERILERDGGRYEFERLELYLDDNITEAKAGRPEVKPPVDGALDHIFAMVDKPAKPTPAELKLIWAKSLEHYEHLMEGGATDREARQQLLDYLEAQPVSIAKNRAALERQFYRKYAAWTEAGRKSVALADQRKGRSGRQGAPALDESSMGLLISRSLNCGGRIQQAWRELWQENKLPAFCYEYYADTNGYRVPEKIRAIARPEVGRMLTPHQGKKAHRLSGARIARDWSNADSGIQFQSDDCTLPVYFWIEDEDAPAGVRVTRGQFFPWIDTPSTYIICFQLIPERSYTALDILRGVNLVHDTIGLPEEFYFEKGIWERAHILKGSQDEVDGRKQVYGLEDIGIKIRNAQSGPAAKVVERLLGSLQNYMERERGYAGRKERYDAPEHIQDWIRKVESGKLHPSRCFYHYDEWRARLAEICDAYNDAPRDGEQCHGLTPRQRFVKHLKSPLTTLSESQRHLIACNRRLIKVTNHGIVIKLGNRKLIYRSEDTGRFIGEHVMVYFDALSLDSVVFGPNDDELYFANRADAIDALRATDDEIAIATAQARLHDRYARQKYTALKKEHPEEFRNRQLRPVMADSGLNQTGEAIARLQEEAKAAERTKRQRKRTADRLGIRAAPPVSNARDDLRMRGWQLMAEGGVNANNEENQ